MRPRNSVWQGDFGYWQHDFIHDNILMIGYYAWNGFLEVGRGMVNLNIESAAIAAQSTGLGLVPFSAEYIAHSQWCDSALALHLDGDSVGGLEAALNNYDPHQDIILLLSTNAFTEVNLLKSLKIAPPECDRQVRQRWDEFQPCLR
ncbi:MAG TPA: hypothetical protein V6C88_08825 [Chroococcidiopsis sp.]